MSIDVEKLLGQFFTDCLSEISIEGPKFIRQTALSISSKILGVVRKLFLLQLGQNLVGLLWVMSLFATGLFFVHRFSPSTLLSEGSYSTGGTESAYGIVGINIELYYSAAVFLLSSVILWFVAREKTWLSAAGIRTQSEELHRQMRSQAKRQQRHQEIDYAKIEGIVERVVEHKLAAITQTQ